MATTERAWDLANVGNVELQDRNLLFRLMGNGEEDQPLIFAATLTLRDVSKTLRDIERSAKMAGLARERLTDFMKAVASLLPRIIVDIRGEDSGSGSVDPLNEEGRFSLEALQEADKIAQQILNDPDPLSTVDKYLGDIICGEEKNRRILFLKAIGTKTTDKRVKWIVVETGESGAGKTALTKIITKTCRCKVVGRLTAHALDYMELRGYDVLVLQEIGHMDREDHGLSTIKFVSYDDNGYTVEVPTRDPETGEMATKQYRIPPINILTTSTRVSFDPQFERRAEFLNPDESEEQTRRVHEFKAKAERQNIEVKLGTRRWTEAEFAVAVIKAVLACIEDVEVEIAFASVVNRILRSSPMRTRGDIDKIYADVRLYAILCRRQHSPILTPDGAKIVFASPTEAIQVVELFRDSFETMIGGIDKRTKKIIQAMVDLGFKPKQRIGTDERMKLATQLKKSPQTIYQFLERLYSNRLVKKSKEGEGKTAPVFHELVTDPSEMVTSPLLSQGDVEALRHDMMVAGFDFLRHQNLAKETLSGIMKEWGKPIEEGRNRRRTENGRFLGSSGSLNQIRRSMRSIFAEDGPNIRDLSSLKSTPAQPSTQIRVPGVVPARNSDRPVITQAPEILWRNPDPQNLPLSYYLGKSEEETPYETGTHECAECGLGVGKGTGLRCRWIEGKTYCTKDYFRLERTRTRNARGSSNNGGNEGNAER